MKLLENNAFGYLWVSNATASGAALVPSVSDSNFWAVTVPDPGPETAPATYYYLTDRLGTVLALADGSGSVAESYVYDAWGRVLAVYDASGTEIPDHKSQISNRYLFQGREYDWATGLYTFRARWYDPVTGRWLSKDPIGISGGLNQDAFCGDDPVNYRDPSGLEWFPSGPNVPPGTIWLGGISETIGNVWNAPNTALGLGLGGTGMLFEGDLPHNDNDVHVFENNPGVNWFPLPTMAITWGILLIMRPAIIPILICITGMMDNRPICF